MTLWIAIGAIALLSFTFKAAGPAVLGDRELPGRARSVIAMVAPALLAGFVVVDLAGPGWGAFDLTVVAGVAAVVVLRMLRAPLMVAMAGAVVVTAALRFAG
ncbi:AzlD domain-containing protein [Streptomyces sp. AV19]|uniref:AzlD domain-containing protein n=1 Tax=Streptomyces sp. AV19 TaxID=2793068 RepID=UPI0018FF0B8E|nr:AzlD domain-containing protein [Streptomyces sp. AV19]MBH1936718.1 AzlD domain-containing protein [Streptomyces sp. AV19]MDG4532777.1 AzlD domain-containing protein [Streptomyces sp. AV19]